MHNHAFHAILYLRPKTNNTHMSLEILSCLSSEQKGDLLFVGGGLQRLCGLG